MFGMDDPYDQGGQVFGGVGQRLVPEGHPGHSDNHHQRSVRDLACKCHNFTKFSYNLIMCIHPSLHCNQFCARIIQEISCKIF